MVSNACFMVSQRSSIKRRVISFTNSSITNSTSLLISFSNISELSPYRRNTGTSHHPCALSLPQISQCLWYQHWDGVIESRCCRWRWSANCWGWRWRPICYHTAFYPHFCTITVQSSISFCQGHLCPYHPAVRPLGGIISFHPLCVAPDHGSHGLRFWWPLQTDSQLHSALIIHRVNSGFPMDGIAAATHLSHSVQLPALPVLFQFPPQIAIR